MRLSLCRSGSAAVACFAVLAMAACDRAPTPGDVREWTAADHDRAEEAQRQANGQQAPKSVAEARASSRGDGGAGVGANSEAAAIATAVEVTWRNQCAVCHGAIGHGDGPNGALLHATNLTDPSFQSSRTDAELAAAITNGKNRMPKFDFSPAIVAGLIGRIRASNGK